MRCGPIKKQAPETESWLGNGSRDFHSPTLPWCKTARHAGMDTIAAMAQARVQHPFPCEWHSREPAGAYPARRILLLSNAASSIVGKTVGFLF